MNFKVGDRDGKILFDIKSMAILSLFKWRIVKEGTNLYAQSELPRFILPGRVVTIKMHQVVMYWVHGHRKIPGRQIDHINGNGLDNRKNNLRFATSSQNNSNRRKYGGTSKYRGVYRQKSTFIAQIAHRGKRYYLGRFKTETEAARTYDAKAIELFGSYANINFPLRTIRFVEAKEKKI